MNIQIEEFSIEELSLDSNDSLLLGITINNEMYTISYYKIQDTNTWKPLLYLALMLDLDMQHIVDKSVQDYIKLKNLVE